MGDWRSPVDNPPGKHHLEEFHTRSECWLDIVLQSIEEIRSCNFEFLHCLRVNLHLEDIFITTLVFIYVSLLITFDFDSSDPTISLFILPWRTL